MRARSSNDPVAVLPAVATTAITGVPARASSSSRAASAPASIRQSREGIVTARRIPSPSSATARVTA
jgi:hypothetical protein